MDFLSQLILYAVKRFKFFLLITLFFIGFDVYAQKTEESSSVKSVKKITTEIENLKNDAAFKHASWGVCVVKADSNKTIAEYNSEQSLVPASTMKIVTTGAVLSLLGKDYHFKTIIQHDGTIDKDSVLHGNVYIKGGGDPSLGSERFDSCITKLEDVFGVWLTAIEEKGISKIDGAVIADAEIFDEALTQPTWMWGDIGNYYGVSASGLSINENYYNILFNPANKLGYPAKVAGTQPEIPSIQFTNRVTTSKSSSGDQVNVYGSPYSYTRILEGTVPYRKNTYEVKSSIPDPPYLCAYMFNKYLAENGINATKPPTTTRLLKQQDNYNNTERTTIYTHLSPALEEIVYWTNTMSINVFAETLVKIIGYEKVGAGNTNEGAKIIQQFWESKGVNLEGFTMEDGSGLSRMNNVTTRQLVEMLRVMKKGDVYMPFFNSLAVAGKTGSIRNLYIGTPAENNLRAKSGNMNRIRAYAGYVTDKKGEQLIFAIIVNNYYSTSEQMRTKIENLLELLAEIE